MEQKSNNKASTILALIGIIVLVVFVIVMAARGLSKNKDDDDFYKDIRQDAPIVTETPVPTQEAETEGVQDITELLNELTADMEVYLQSTNPKIVTFTTPGLTLEKLGSIRTVTGQSVVETWTYWEADNDLSTAALKGDYVVNFNLATENGPKKLYLYVWTNKLNGLYVSMLNYEIGDF